MKRKAKTELTGIGIRFNPLFLERRLKMIKIVRISREISDYNHILLKFPIIQSGTAYTFEKQGNPSPRQNWCAGDPSSLLEERLYKYSFPLLRKCLHLGFLVFDATKVPGESLEYAEWESTVTSVTVWVSLSAILDIRIEYRVRKHGDFGDCVSIGSCNSNHKIRKL